jgi:hypothetical protein
METQASQPKQPALNDDLRAVEYEAKRRREDLLEACRRAVECLERFAADARREVDRAAELDSARLVDLPDHVLSASAWGSANAATELSSATRMAAAYMNALGELEARKGAGR